MAASAAESVRAVAKRALELFEPKGPDAIPPDSHSAQRVRIASLIADEYGHIVAPQAPPGAAAAFAIRNAQSTTAGVAGGMTTTKMLEDATESASSSASKGRIAPASVLAASASRGGSLALVAVAGSGANSAGSSAALDVSGTSDPSSATVRRIAASTKPVGASSASTPSLPSSAAGARAAAAAVEDVVAALDAASAVRGVAAGGSQAGMRRADELAAAARAGSRVAASRGRPRQLATPRWHAPWEPMRVIAGLGGWVRCVAVDPSNEFFVTGSADRNITVWDLASGTRKLTLTGHISTVRGVVLSDRHPYLFSAGEDKKVMCWDLEHNKVIRHYHGHLSGVYALAMHPGLDILFSAGRDAVCRVWDMRTRAAVHTLSGHTNAVASVVVQGTDPQVITGSMDSTIRLWDLVAGKTMAVLTHHSKAVRALALGSGPGPEGGTGRAEHSFVSGGADCVRKWHAGTGQFLFGMRGHRSIVHTLACNDDGVLVSGADDGGYKMWDVATGHCFQSDAIAVQPGSLDSEAAIFCSAFDMTGTRLITGGADKTVRIWREVSDATPDSHPVDLEEYRRQVRRAEEAGGV